ncbi:hypothetical protein [Fuscovulum ytuae]|uniref:Uncharacterized protein n=1 Tax=Fuscovulum ytuae TaxID=3042299 RepID=A0ABY8Q8Q9_9RHOB|nr:hypothetical protein [Fuscovulum sp. YMD61]WGV17264.1 hypothetical protein QF092_05510 [Fuscovulum sp. YMD61]
MVKVARPLGRLGCVEHIAGGCKGKGHAAGLCSPVGAGAGLARGGMSDYLGAMTAKHRLIRSLLLALFTAATLARAELGADSEASALFTPAFALAFPVALVGGWLLAGAFGQGGLGGWLRAVLATAGLLLAVGLVVPLLQGGGMLSLLAEVPRWPLAWGAGLAGALATQAVALRQGQSRK